MRILYVTYAYPPAYWAGGPPLKVQSLAETLARKHDVRVLTSRRLPYVVTAERVSEGVRITDLGCWFQYRSTGSFTVNPGIIRFLAKELPRIDVVHIFGLNDFLGPVAGAYCRRWNVPYVVEPLGMYRARVRSFRKKKVYRRHVADPLIGHAAKVIATADTERADLVSAGIPLEKISVRRNGVNLRDFDPLPPRGMFRQEFGLSERETIALFLGRVSPIKRLDILIRAFSKVRRPQGRLVIVGPDEDGLVSSLRSLALSLGIDDQVVFTGPIYGPDRIKALIDADVVVLPSARENFGNSVAEAVVAGTPVIVTETCGVARQVEDAGLIIDLSETQLTRALDQMIRDSNLRDRLATGASALSTRLSWDEPAREMELLYSQLLTKTQVAN